MIFEHPLVVICEIGDIEVKIEYMLFFGINPLAEALNSKYSNLIDEIIFDRELKNKRLERLLEIAKSKNIKLRAVSKSVMNSIIRNSSHQGVAFEVDVIYEDIEDLIFEKKNLVLCDSIQDPVNLGSILRNALLFGFEGVVITKDRSIDITPTVAKVSSGALFHLSIVKVVNLARTIDFLKDNGYTVIGLDVRGEKEISEVKVNLPVSIVVGSEGEGIRELVKKKCSMLCHIKTTNKLDSLNASVASAISMYEIFKQSISKRNI